jgi:natural product precursor
MKNNKTTFGNFEIEKLSKKQQKTILGGGGDDPVDPVKGNGKGSGY